jgi:hypothetical protein
MDFIRNHLPDCPLQARKYHCPATALNLDSEIAGVFWIYFCGRTIAQLFPGGIHFEVHVQIEMNENEIAEEAGHADDERQQQHEEDHDDDDNEEDEIAIAVREQRALEDLT